MPRGAGAAAELLGQHFVIGKALRDHRAEHPLHFEIDFGDQIDGALLVDTDAGTEPGEVDLAGAHDRFDGRGQEPRVGAHDAAVAARFIIQICMPPSGCRLSDTSSM